MGEKQGHTPEVDFEAVADGVLDAIRPVVEREMREAANQLYGATLEAVQDYLSDNASFNIRSRMETAERSRRIEWERAEGLSKTNAELLAGLRSLTQYEGHHVYCAKRDDDSDNKRCVCGYDTAIDKARAAISRPTGEDSPANEGEGA